jgi:uncharacterized protein (DUF58 family)
MKTQEVRLPSIFIVPLMQFFVGLVLFIALLNGHLQLAVMAILVLVIFWGSRAWSRLSLSGIQCHSTVDRQKVFPGEKLVLRVEAQNSKFLPVWLKMEVQVDGLLLPFTRENALSDETGLLWYQRASFNWELTARQRGVHRVGPLRVQVGDLLGFFQRERATKDSLYVTVYPRIVPLKPLSLPRRDLFGLPGARSPVQDPVYILGTRNYQHRSPARFIHWKASARLNRLQEKIFEPSEQEKILLVLEVDRFSENGAGEDFERIIEAVASLAVRMDHMGYATGFATNGALCGGGPAILPITKNSRQLPAILEVLARVQMKPSGEILEILDSGLELPWGVSVIYFSYQKDMSTQSIEQYFSLRKTPMASIVCRNGSVHGFDVAAHRTVHLLKDIFIVKEVDG